MLKKQVSCKSQIFNIMPNEQKNKYAIIYIYIIIYFKFDNSLIVMLNAPHTHRFTEVKHDRKYLFLGWISLRTQCGLLQPTQSYSYCLNIIEIKGMV